MEDSITIPFEQSFFEDLERGTEDLEEIDLDELYASFENVPDEDLPVFSDEEIERQVNNLSGNINIRYNSEIKPYINKLTSKRGRKFVSKMLALSQLYFPIFDQILLEEGLPNDLKYAAVVESALLPNIMSRAGAVGLWQFMRGTGKQYDLEIGNNIDERCDIYKSTRAAARYMRSLYATYGDWLLVLAAYNCGPGNVNKAMARSGGTDFWGIYEKLPRETRRHIPKFIAIYYAFHYHKDLMIAPMRDMVKYTQLRRVRVDKPIHLGQVAKVLNIEEKDLAKLNRNFLRGYIPANKKHYKLVLPIELLSLFDVYQDSIYAYDREKYFAKNGKYIAKRKEFYPVYGALGSGKPIVYRVRRGDVLGKIARRFGTSVRNIKNWNGLRSDRIRIGQKLRVYTSAKYSQNYKPTKAKTKSTAKNIKLPYLPNKYVYHTIKKGENCWTIAKQYEGVTQQKIVELNQLANPQALRIGQKLRIKEKN
ncbi:MAG: LysM peptidoglycan-binding domain-containing protein [Flavobacteriaceae bacterium]|nr:LysM peptidoglycan-binding domain-containing protein [Flavobacteriaceae bacterium]